MSYYVDFIQFIALFTINDMKLIRLAAVQQITTNGNLMPILTDSSQVNRY